MYKGLRPSTMTINGRHYTTSLTTIFLFTMYLASTDFPFRYSFMFFLLPFLIRYPLNSIHYHHPQHWRFFHGKMGYSPTVWACRAGWGGGGGDAYMPVGSFGHQKIERKIPCRKGTEDSRLDWGPNLGWRYSTEAKIERAEWRGD